MLYFNEQESNKKVSLETFFRLIYKKRHCNIENKFIKRDVNCIFILFLYFAGQK